MNASLGASACACAWCGRGQEVAQPFSAPRERCGGPADVHVCCIGNHNVRVQHTYACTHSPRAFQYQMELVRWSQIFFLSHICFFHYAFRVMILLFWLAAIASFPLLNIQKVPLYIIRSRRVFCFSADSRTMSHCQHCSFHNQDHRGRGLTGRVSHKFKNWFSRMYYMNMSFLALCIIWFWFGVWFDYKVKLLHYYYSNFNL